MLAQRLDWRDWSKFIQVNDGYIYLFAWTHAGNGFGGSAHYMSKHYSCIFLFSSYSL